MLLDTLPEDVQRKIWNECAYHRVRNPYHLLGSGSFFEQLKRGTTTLIVCSEFNFQTEHGTVTLSEECTADEAIEVIAAVGESVRELRIFAPLFTGAEASIFFEKLVKQSPKVENLKLKWTTKEATLNAGLICMLLNGIGSQIIKLDIDTQQTIPDEVMKCISTECYSIKGLRYSGYMMRISMRSHWNTLCSKLQVIDIADARMTGRDWSWLLKMLKYFSPNLTKLRLGQHRLSKSQAKDLKKVYIKHATGLKEASISTISPYSCEEVVKHCKQLVTCSVLEDDELFRRIATLGHRIRHLYLMLPDDVNNRNLKEAMELCQMLISLRVGHQRATLREGVFDSLFSSALPHLEVLEIHLHGSSITDANIDCISRATSKLKQLHLTGEAEYSAPRLQALFEKNQKLKKVSFSTRPGAEVVGSLRVIVESLLKCKSLRELRWDRYRPADMSTIAAELTKICAPLLKRGVEVIVSGVMLSASRQS